MTLTRGDRLHWGLKPLVRLYLNQKFHLQILENPLESLEGPYLLLGHHVTAFDPLMANLLSSRLIRFVASDVNYDAPVKKFFLEHLEAIPFSKNHADSKAVRLLLKHVEAGHPVGLYPEGGRNWDGETERLISSTAKLVKLLKVPVYQIRSFGGYLSKPRWASHFRKGKLQLAVRKILDPEEIRIKSAEEIRILLEEALAYNEYDWQRKARIPFLGKQRAEHIQRLLYLCPQCGSWNTQKSQGNAFQCTACGLHHEVDVYGFLQGSGPFADAAAWNRWQRVALGDLLEKGFTFENPELSLEVIPEGRPRTKEKITLIFQRDHLTLKRPSSEEILRFEDLGSLSITLLDVVEFYQGTTKYRLVFEPEKHMSVKLFYDLLALLLMKGSV